MSATIASLPACHALGEELLGLRIEAGFVEIEQTLGEISPGVHRHCALEEGLGPAKEVDGQVCGFVRIIDAAQARVEALDEGEIRRGIRAVDREIEAGRADKVEVGVQVAGTEHTSDSDRRIVGESLDERRGCPRLPGGIGVSDRVPSLFGSGDHASPLLVRESGELVGAVGLTLDE